MGLSRSPLFGSVVWGMVALALWSSVPSMGCLCADGGYRFFCHGHEASPAATQIDPGTSTRSCCSQRASAAPRDCCQRSDQTASQFACSCCERLATGLTLVWVPKCTRVAPDYTLALDSSTILLPHVAIAAVSQPAQLVSRPPGDLVISLHILLI
jgi:hypothetical protein